MRSHGVSAELMALYVSDHGMEHASAADECTLGVASYQSFADMPTGAAGRWGSFIFKQLKADHDNGSAPQ